MTESNFPDETLLELERSLKTKLNPVHPDGDFVRDLKARLEHATINDQQRRIAVKLLTVVIGLLVGLVIFLIGREFTHRGEQT